MPVHLPCRSLFFLFLFVPFFFEKKKGTEKKKLSLPI